MSTLEGNSNHRSLLLVFSIGRSELGSPDMRSMRPMKVKASNAVNLRESALHSPSRIQCHDIAITLWSMQNDTQQHAAIFVPAVRTSHKGRNSTRPTMLASGNGPWAQCRNAPSHRARVKWSSLCSSAVDVMMLATLETVSHGQKLGRGACVNGSLSLDTVDILSGGTATESSALARRVCQARSKTLLRWHLAPVQTSHVGLSSCASQPM